MKRLLGRTPPRAKTKAKGNASIPVSFPSVFSLPSVVIFLKNFYHKERRGHAENHNIPLSHDLLGEYGAFLPGFLNE
jgi:hypothetical protein